jgi:hypothetical protein
MRRLLAATLSLVLVAASIIGSYAHACHEGHHQHSSLQHVGHPEHGSASEGGPNAETNAPHGHGLPSSSGESHTFCSDFVCHCCMAILADASQSERIAQRKAVVIPPEDLRVGRGPFTLDRPPKASVIV